MAIAAPGSDPSVNPWLSLCSIRLSALDDPSIPSIEMKSKYIQELRWVEEARAAIQYRVNMLSPFIAQLTPEMLAHVFRHLADIDAPHEIVQEEMIKAYSGWMKVTHVCRSWRIVALGYPDLWGRRNICSPRSWMKERIRRSKRASFDISFTDASFETRIPHPLLVNTNRIRCAILSTYIPWDATHRSWRDLLSLSAASLESFTYMKFGDARASSVSYDALPANAFDGKAPRLKFLRLHGTILPFESAIYDNLTHLRLGSLGRRDRNYRGPPPFTREQLLALLHRMLKLESLTMEDRVIPGESPIIEDSEDDAQVSLPTPGPVVLSSLQMLELRGSQPDCVWMATQLSIPAAESLIIRPRVPYEEYEASGRAFLPLLMRHLGARDRVRPIQTMSINLEHRSWRFICWRELIYSDIDPRKTHEFDLDYIVNTTWVEDRPNLPCCNIWSKSDDITIDVFETIMRPVLSEAVTCNIRVLDICGAKLQIGCTDWLELFASFTALESLTLGDTVIAFNFVQVFGLDLALNLDTFSTTGDTPHALFPSLRVLMFREVDFKRFVDTADAKLSELMTESLIERLTINTTLEEVRLIWCKWSQPWIDSVRRIGPKVFCEAPLSWKDSGGSYE